MTKEYQSGLYILIEKNHKTEYNTTVETEICFEKI